MQLILESLFNGVAIGSVLLIAALGLAIVFGLMGVINLAHGELMMLGAYSTYVTQLIFKLPILQPFYNAYVIVAIPIAFLVSGVVGILLERSVIRRLYGSPLETLLATWGVSLILQQFVRSVPLAYGTGLIIAILLGITFPIILRKRFVGRKDNQILITKRKLGGLLGGLWEFPGGKLNSLESSEECVLREIYEETGLNVELKSFISNIKHQYSHFSISLDSFHCIYKNGIAEPHKSTDLKWIYPKEIQKFAFPKANHKFIHKIPENNPWL